MSADRVNLNLIDVPNPCTVPWEEMSGDDRVRFCGKCRKNVYHLSHLTRDEAERLVTEREGELCVQFYRRQDGTAVTRDCAVVRAAKKAGSVFWLALCSLAAVAAFFVGRKLDWFSGYSNQTFSKVGGGIGPPH